MNSKSVRQYNVVNKLDTNFKTPEDKRMYQRDYQRLRYQNDPNFRQKIINNSARTRLKKQLSKPKDIIMECVLNKIQQGPKPDTYCIHTPKKRGRPSQVDENGVRFFKPHKFTIMQTLINNNTK
jgi:hypothetical protein